MNSFESKLLAGFGSAVKAGKLGIGVSGGADSIALLTGTCRLIKENRLSAQNIFVITVNHYIRPENETCGDAAFVVDYCNQLKLQGLPVTVELCELGKGEVQKKAEERGAGIEEAARYLRYQKFEEFIGENQLDYLCLAHNRNDQVETLVMRFLQGSSSGAAGGIRSERGQFLRPMLEISRKEIEEYLKECECSWRNDSTNFDTDYLRNKIRHKLIPVLDDLFPGWQGSVLNGGEKQRNINLLVQKLVEQVPFELKKIDGESAAVCCYSDFIECNLEIKIQVLLRMFNTVSEESRIPYKFLKEVCNEISMNGENCLKKEEFWHFSNMEIICKNNEIIVKKYAKTETDLCFFDIIEETGNYEFPFGVLSLHSLDDGKASVYVNDESLMVKVPLPVCVRNAQPGDVVMTADGNYKKVADVFSDWKVREDKKLLIPVLQDVGSSQKILCILGCVSGFNNWIVKE